MKHFGLIIFDMDGLLLDSEQVALEIFKQTCQAFSISADPGLYRLCIGVNAQRAEEILRAGLESLVDYDAFQDYWITHYEKRVHDNEIPLKPGVINLLEAISCQDIPMMVATSTETARAKLKLANTRLIDYFEDIIGGDQVAASKPAPDIYLKAAARKPIGASECLAIEDSENGVLAALAAGMTVIQIPDLIKPSQEFRANGHQVLASLNDVIDFLER